MPKRCRNNMTCILQTKRKIVAKTSVVIHMIAGRYFAGSTKCWWCCYCLHRCNIPSILHNVPALGTAMTSVCYRSATDWFRFPCDPDHDVSVLPFRYWLILILPWSWSQDNRRDIIQMALSYPCFVSEYPQTADKPRHDHVTFDRLTCFAVVSRWLFTSRDLWCSLEVAVVSY